MALKLSKLIQKPLFFFLLCSFTKAKSQVINGSQKSPVSAIFAFGDSTVDAGNNNYIATPMKSNFPPYGRDFFTHIPTGRFTNGKLITDFVGIKEELPPYLDWSLGLEELMTGVSFGSAGSGLDPDTAKITDVIPVLGQLDYFRNYMDRLDQMIGMKTRVVIKRAVFVLSAGTNDFIAFSTVPLTRKEYSIEGYQGFLLDKVKEFIQVLSNFGANRIVVAGLPPMGCLPIVITLKANDGIHDRGCISSLNSIALDYNQKLQATLQEFSSSSSSTELQIFYVDSYKPLIDIITSPASYGFMMSSEGCCGTGLVEAAVLCNPKSLTCIDASKYIFWDSIHPTEKAYYIMFNSFKPVIDYVLKSY
ncbi:GDSL esterase/lipase At5g45960 isoform X2 [Phalaenopsis equestris]|uniref:GDSL esterase/lipase At5g45960 isoform X2 n=1 Tax=Phalaenopsis equestris TaxID=78828 RepID=UPI0009E1E00C|nr:GDSL esterase/lipase At5g45960 isoform X2 [Phalaenopsis equestris]